MKVRDPVCEKEIELSEVVATEDRDGWAYFFCSERCHMFFMASPESFAQKPANSRANAAI